MKKSLFLAALAMLGGLSASAESLTFGYCSDQLGSPLGNSSGQYMSAAIEIPAETAKQWDGNKLTGIEVGFGDSDQREITLFLADDLMEKPFQTQKVVATNKNAWNSYTLDTPYEFNGQAVYIGYYIRLSKSTDYAIGVDRDIAGANPCGDYMSIGGGLASMRENWEHVGYAYGNVSIRLIIEGDNLPAYDAVPASPALPEVIKPGVPFDISARIVNRGLKSITKFAGQVTIGDAEPYDFDITLDKPVASGASADFEIKDIVHNVEGYELPVKIAITTIEGEANGSATQAVTTETNCSDYAWERVMVCEEGTGTWCANCPRGIVGVEKMYEKYPDTFIAIAMHDSQDAKYGMYVPEYQTVLSYLQQFPMSISNRVEIADPGFSSLERVYGRIKQPVYAKVSVDAKFVEGSNDTQILATASTLFGRDFEDEDFRIAFVLTEDKVIAQQANNYHDNQLGEMGGWENKPAMATVALDHVARYISNVYGDKASSVKEVAKGETKVYERVIDLPSSVRDPHNLRIVALLIDNASATRPIYTAGEVTAANSLYTGVESVVDDADSVNAPVEYYNLQGVRVERPAAGEVCIRRQGSKVSKIVVR